MLGLRRAKVEGSGAFLLMRSLKYHRVMTVDLSDNALGSPGAQAADALAQSKADANLWDAHGFEKGPIMRSLKALFKSNSYLTHLDLSWNGFRQDMCLKLGEWLKTNSTILGLHMLGNGTSAHALKKIMVHID